MAPSLHTVGRFSLVVSTYVLVALLVWFAVSLYGIRLYQRDRDLITHNLLIEEQVFIDLKAAESAQRGYLLTEGLRPGYRAQYVGAIAALTYDLKILHEVVSDDSFERDKTHDLEALVQQKCKEMDSTFTAFSELGFRAAQRIVDTNEGRDLMTQIEQVVDRLRAHDTVRLEQRQKKKPF